MFCEYMSVVWMSVFSYDFCEINNGSRANIDLIDEGLGELERCWRDE